jgi:DNA modification methylase
LQADGWYLRSDVVWSKPNPMPESVTDRPTKSHEYVFLLSKRERYYFDADAVREGHRPFRPSRGMAITRNLDRRQAVR